MGTEKNGLIESDKTLDKNECFLMYVNELIVYWLKIAGDGEMMLMERINIAAD